MFGSDLTHHLHVTSYTLCALLCVTSLVQCSVVSFSTTPSTIKALVTDSLELRCGVRDGAPTGTSGIIGKREVISTDLAIPRFTPFDHSYSDISKRSVKTSDIAIVSSISIAINNADVAVVTAFVPAKVFNNNGGVHVTGNVTASGAERGFLQVTWDYPDSNYIGSYLCTVTGYDVDGHQHILTETVDVDDSEVNLNDIVKYVHQLKLDNQQQNQLIEQQKQSIEQQKLDSQNQNQLIEQQKLINNQQTLINELQNQSIAQQKQLIEQQTADISQLKDEISTLQKSNADLATHVNTTVMFTAYIYNDVTVQTGNALVFDKLAINIGGGFNTTTGVFTSPMSGYFIFYIKVRAQRHKMANIFLSHNGSAVIWARGDDGFDDHTASNSVALLLMKGDNVSANSYGTSYLDAGAWGETSLSGYLINLV